MARRLQPGKYWSDAIGERLDAWVEWQKSVGASVRLISTVPHHDEDPPREWLLWRVFEAVDYDETTLPHATPAEGVEHESDTVSRPDPETTEGLVDRLLAPANRAAATISLAVGVGLAVGLAIGVAKALGSLKKR